MRLEDTPALIDVLIACRQGKETSRYATLPDTRSAWRREGSPLSCVLKGREGLAVVGVPGSFQSFSGHTLVLTRLTQNAFVHVKNSLGLESIRYRERPRDVMRLF